MMRPDNRRISGALARGTAFALATTCMIAFMAGGAAAEQVVTEQASAARDSSMTLQGGSEGTVFKSLEVRGEDRIRITFERPELILNLDPADAPGLEWKSVHAVLDRDRLDFLAPLLGVSAGDRRQCFARPWLDHLSTNGVARFRPALEGVERWRLLVANSRGEQVAQYEGKGKPPKEIVWDGRSLDGKPVPPGLVYTYVLEAYDRAGNKKNFVGDGFEIPSYVIESSGNLTILFSGAELSASRMDRGGSEAPTPEILLEIADYLNRERSLDAPVRIEVSARSFEEAKNLAQQIVDGLKPVMLGDVLRLQPVTTIERDAPEHGTVEVVVAR